MAATFNPALPTQLDWVRLNLGDKHDNATAGDVTDPLLTDEVIQGAIDGLGYLGGLASLAEALASKYALMPTEFKEADGGPSFKWSERIAHWQRVADRARSGQIKVPCQSRRTRYPVAIAQTTVQRTLTDPGSGFRSD